MPRALAFRRLSAALPLLAMLGLSPSARADLLLNEVLYDPEGADEGLEFVELWNPDPVSVSLEGITIEAADGVRPGSWSVIYTGAAGDSALPASAFLVPGTLIHAAIQNGPDALRLTRAGVVLDLVGYGALTDPQLYRGAPADDAPSGQSLARLRDGADTGSNAADWAAEAEPSPGRPNHPDVRLVIARGSASLRPEVPWPGEEALLSTTVRNRGRLVVDAALWRVEVALRNSNGADTSWPSAPSVACPGVAIAPGESASVRCPFLVPPRGLFELRVMLRDLGPAGWADPAIADTVFVLARSSAGPVVVNEIAFRDRGAGEWVELRVLEEVPDLGALALSDAGGHVVAIDRGAIPRGARPGDLFVVAESPPLVRAAYALPESLVLGCRGGWPSLNDTDGEDGFADRVSVLDTRGIPSDAAPYRSEYTERGSSIERLSVGLSSASSNSWSESIDPLGGTPGRHNSIQALAPGSEAAGTLLLATSRVLRRAPGAPITPVVLGFGEVARGRRVRVLVHDLLGRPRRHLVDGQRVLGAAAFVWDGRDDSGAPVPAGTYVARAETIPDGTEPARSGNVALTVVGR